MNKYEFLQQLEDQLRGQVSVQELRDSVNYYNNYIDEEIRAGRSEEDVLDSLGSANSIAKSIIEAQGGEYEGSMVYDQDDQYQEDSYGEQRRDSSVKVFSANGWKAWLTIGLTILGLVLIFSLMFRAVMLLIPFLLPMAIAGIVVHIFRAGR